MQTIISEFGLLAFAAAFGVMALAGFVKGAVGFALPMIVVSGIGSLMSAEMAIAAIIVPSLVTNLMQAFREGFGAALATLRRFWRLNLVLLIMIALCAQLVVLLPEAVFFVVLGCMVSGLGTVLLVGWRPRLAQKGNRLAEIVAAVIAGFFGGLAGVWGPPILIYLLARDVAKKEMVRAQGISFLLGSVILAGAHVGTGVLSAVTVPFSALLVVPAVLGMWLGQAAQDRLDQARFRRLTLIVLVIAGLNLLRRGLMG